MPFKGSSIFFFLLLSSLHYFILFPFLFFPILSSQFLFFPFFTLKKNVNHISKSRKETSSKKIKQRNPNEEKLITQNVQGLRLN